MSEQYSRVLTNAQALELWPRADAADVGDSECVESPKELRVEMLVGMGMTAEDARKAAEQPVGKRLRVKWACMCHFGSSSLFDGG